MADTVRYLLEQMVPELEDYEKRGLFTRQELKQVVKKRTSFEYILKRRAPEKEDYLRYIEYELQLDSLRKLRKAAIERGMKSANIKWKSSLSDRAITRRVLFIYERALRKFKGDLKLWLKCTEFCRMRGATRHMQKVVTRALQLHPCTPGLWMYAAAWEFEHNLNEKAARTLMQQGLRMCPASEALWLEYLRLELACTRKIKARQLLLSSGDLPIEGLEDGSSKPEQADKTIRKLDELSAKMALTIFRNAVAALPRSMKLRLHFLQILEEVDFAGAKEVREEVVNNLMQNFPGSVECCKLLVERALKERGGSNACDVDEAELHAIQIYENSLDIKPSPTLFEAFIEFLEDRMISDHDRADCQSPSGKKASKTAEKLAAVYEKARIERMLTQRAAEKRIAFLMRQGLDEETLEAACRPSECCPEAAGSLWAHRMALELQGQHTGAKKNSDGGEQSFGLFGKAVETVKLSESLPLWRQFMESATLRGGVGEIVDLAGTLLTRNGGGAGSAELECTIVTWVLQLRGSEEARAVCNRLLALPSPTEDLVRCYGRMEAQAAAAGDAEAMPRLRKAFDGWLSQRQATDSAFWLEYCRLELQFGSPQAAAAVYWRAKKSLKDPSAFIADYQELTAGHETFDH